MHILNLDLSSTNLEKRATNNSTVHVTNNSTIPVTNNSTINVTNNRLPLVLLSANV